VIKTVVQSSKTALEAVKSKITGKSLPEVKKTALELLKEDYARIKEAKEPLSNTDKIRGFVDQHNKEQEKIKQAEAQRAKEPEQVKAPSRGLSLGR
jgi:hypothetical protein